MRRWIAALCLLLPLLVLPLGAASFPQADALLREAESYGADPSEGLAQGRRAFWRRGWTSWARCSGGACPPG